jgi:hypothetical protein
LKDPPKFTQIGIIGLKSYHLATMSLCRIAEVPKVFFFHSSEIYANFLLVMSGRLDGFHGFDGFLRYRGTPATVG